MSLLAKTASGNAWAHRSWTEFREWPDKATTLILCPVAAHFDWNLGHALDDEEILLAQLLTAASAHRPAGLSWLVLPALRFVAGAHARAAFPAPLALAFRQLREIGLAVKRAGFSRVVFVNAHPFAEDIVDAAGRDLRVQENLQCFVVNLGGLGLDLHPRAPSDRQQAQTLLTAFHREAPATMDPPPVSGPPPPPSVSANWIPNDWIQPQPISVEEATQAAPALLDPMARHFVRLVMEIRDRPALAPSVPADQPPTPGGDA